MRAKAKELNRKSGGKPKIEHLLDLAETFQSTLHNLAIEVNKSAYYITSILYHQDY